MNSVLVGLVETGDDGEIDPDTIIPMIDGGTEGFKGQARVILPGITACFECTLELFPPKTTFQICTIAHTPRRPEHCIEYARIFKWAEDKPFLDEKGEPEKPDMDNPLHLRWMYEVAKKRADVCPCKMNAASYTTHLLCLCRNSISRGLHCAALRA